MRSRLFWRRSAAAAGTYASAALGFGATVVALHVFSTETFGRYALVLAATAFFQSLLDLTVEEALVKFGFRFVTREDWGRLRRLFASAVGFKLAGGVLATGLLLAFAPAANTLLHKHGLTTPLLIGAFIPLAQCTENVGGVALVLRGRYDVRAFFLLVLGRVASTRQVAFFRAAMSPQQAFAVVSAPARLILLTEQTRDWERGTREAVFSGIRRYMLGMTAAAVVLLPPLLVFTPDIARLLFSAKNVGAVDATRIVIVAGALRMVYGWTKSFPVSIGRPALRIWTHGLEMLVLVPLVGVLGSKWGANGAATAVLVSSIAFCSYWTFLFLRIRREPAPKKGASLEAALP